MQRVNRYRVVPVVVLNDLEETRAQMEALIRGGLPIAEITYRTACAKDAIALTAKEFPEILVGAGTVINKDQCKEAISLGAKFIVSPGFVPEVSKVCKKEDIPYFPGCVTPTEIIEAINDGWTTIKFFPAQVYGGLAAMKALAGPFPQIKFIPTGGVDASNLAEYLAWDKLQAVGGSWMMKGSPAEIEAKCKEIAGIVNGN
ncbi:MAG: bifunctional 4-hydroxy-2-oxoglutarate aldolase/2-dehydro-3-deoxy-phosphogluconate aldolase [Eubacteriales bacterium]